MKENQIDFAHLFDSLPGLYLILSKDLTIITANKAYTRATMTNKEDIVGRGMFDVFPDNPEDESADGVSNLSKSLQSVIKNKMPHTMAVQKYDVKRPDGTFEPRYWSPINIPVLDSENEIAYIIHRVEDVTEFVELKKEKARNKEKTIGLEKKVNEMEVEIIKRSGEIQRINNELEDRVKERTSELREKELLLENQNKRLKSQNKELEQFTYITSHDLQEPLRTLISFSQRLEKEYKSELKGRAIQYVDFISKASMRMKELVKVLMDYSRIGKEKEITFVDSGQILEEILSDMSLLINENSAEINIAEMPKLNAYSVELRQLFQNLIGNSIKFRKKDIPPRIKIKASEDEDQWLFSVEDNGIGIEEENIHRLFIIFKRLHNRHEYEGTGIGLAHSKKIVEMHEGNIWVESKFGVGSIFNFTITKNLKQA
ncbi:PAS domain-containing protein [Marivirga sp. S37H4]|uniref:histidine kinase n=1 Tax=Marivirga aurantiaca TaxID=2802615 RepID=A0A934WVQ3_9BACT|nr:ATP-binding protein [Marivirga aurantiaca]MBK6263811.1 PAS domain-containing protein [Marivirga aurantiaca]